MGALPWDRGRGHVDCRFRLEFCRRQRAQGIAGGSGHQLRHRTGLVHGRSPVGRPGMEGVCRRRRARVPAPRHHVPALHGRTGGGLGGAPARRPLGPASERPMEPLLLGIDVGTSAVKAALMDRRGSLHAVGQAEYPLHHIRPAWVEQDPDDWWRGTCQAIREALAKVPHGAERVLGLAVSCQAPALLALDRSGRPLRPAMIWMDRRAEAETLQLAEQMGGDRIYRVTGNRPDALYVAARLLWLRNHEPETLRRTWQFVQVNGYINYRLTGRLTLDPSNAVLLQLRNYATGEWSEALCSACGVDPAQFPEVMEGHCVQGEVTAGAAEATGLRAGTPVMAGTVDSPAAALEAGVAEPGIAVEMTGTSTVVIMPNDRGLTEPALIAMPHALPGIHLLLGAM